MDKFVIFWCYIFSSFRNLKSLKSTPLTNSKQKSQRFIVGLRQCRALQYGRSFSFTNSVFEIAYRVLISVAFSLDLRATFTANLYE